MLTSIHHIALIVSDYEKSKAFYTEVLGLEIIQEVYREERQSYKLDLALNGVYIIELFSFPDYKPRASRPEALGLRHLAFATDAIEEVYEKMKQHGVPLELLRLDPYTSKQFFFMFDPDGLPIEIYANECI